MVWSSSIDLHWWSISSPGPSGESWLNRILPILISIYPISISLTFPIQSNWMILKINCWKGINGASLNGNGTISVDWAYLYFNLGSTEHPKDNPISWTIFASRDPILIWRKPTMEHIIIICFTIKKKELLMILHNDLLNYIISSFSSVSRAWRTLQIIWFALSAFPGAFIAVGGSICSLGVIIYAIRSCFIAIEGGFVRGHASFIDGSWIGRVFKFGAFVDGR